MVNLQKIKIIAQSKRITIRYLAKEVGITEQGLQALIRNNSTTTDTLYRIAEVLSVPVSTFFEENETLVSKATVKPKVFLAFEIDESQEEKVVKMVLGKEFIKLINQ